MIEKLIELKRFKCLAIVLVVNLFLRFVLAFSLPITYKEAYFWEWSLFPSAGYLDHPPMVSWLIGFSSCFHSIDSPLTVRFTSLLIGTVSFYLIYRLAFRLFESRKIAFRSTLIATCFPVLNVIFTLIIPDTPLIFFQLLALNILVSVKDKDSLVKWGLLGGILGLGLLSKVAMLLTILPIVIFGKLIDRSLNFKKIAVLSCAAIFVFSPNLYWNANHDWASFQLQLWDRHLWSFGLQLGKIGEYIFEQVAAATPFLLPLLVGCLFIPVSSFKKEEQNAFLFLKIQVGLVLGGCLLAGSMVTQTHPHWTSLAYAPAAILLAGYFTNLSSHRLLSRLPSFVKVVQVGFAVVVFIISITPQLIVHVNPDWLGENLGKGLVKGKQRLLGFSQLNGEIEKRLEEQGLSSDTVLYSDTYQFSAPLSFSRGDGKLPVICLPAHYRVDRVLGCAQPFYLPLNQINEKEGLFILHNKNSGVEKMLNGRFQEVMELEPVRQIYADQVIAEYRIFYLKRVVD